MRSANPTLTWRDVKLIMAESAGQNDPEQRGCVSGANHYGGDGVYTYNPNYGFGSLDAQAAVELAQDWVNLPPMTEARVESDRLRAIPDSNRYPLRVYPQVEDDEATTPLFVEHVELNLHVRHGAFRDLDIDLISPAGTVSHLAWPDGDFYNYRIDRIYSYGSAAHLGEDPVGEWEIIVRDTVGQVQGTLLDWSLVLQRQFTEGCSAPPSGRRGVWRESGWPDGCATAPPPATAATPQHPTAPGAASRVPPGTPAAC